MFFNFRLFTTVVLIMVLASACGGGGGTTSSSGSSSSSSSSSSSTGSGANDIYRLKQIEILEITNYEEGMSEDNYLLELQFKRDFSYNTNNEINLDRSYIGSASFPEGRLSSQSQYFYVNDGGYKLDYKDIKLYDSWSDTGTGNLTTSIVSEYSWDQGVLTQVYQENQNYDVDTGNPSDIDYSSYAISYDLENLQTIYEVDFENNGSYDYTYVLSWNENVQLIKVEQIQGSFINYGISQASWEQEHFYNEDGRIIQSITYQPFYDIREESEFDYSTAGEVKVFTTVYDDMNQMTEVTIGIFSYELGSCGENIAAQILIGFLLPYQCVGW